MADAFLVLPCVCKGTKTMWRQRVEPTPGSVVLSWEATLPFMTSQRADYQKRGSLAVFHMHWGCRQQDGAPDRKVLSQTRKQSHIGIIHRPLWHHKQLISINVCLADILLSGADQALGGLKGSLWFTIFFSKKENILKQFWYLLDMQSWKRKGNTSDLHALSKIKSTRKRIDLLTLASLTALQ